MEFVFTVVWCFMDYASKGERVVVEFEKTIRTPNCFGNMEVSSFVFNVMYLKRAEDVVPFPLQMDAFNS
jgi:hypothetical protein